MLTTRLLAGSKTATVAPGVGVVETGATGGAISDAQTGDVVVAYQGYLTNATVTLLSGFTSITKRSSTYNWGANATYYVTGEAQYKILDGTETTIPSATGGGNWVQYRAASAITSVTLSEVDSTQASTWSGTYSAVAETAGRLACIRVVGTAGYNTASSVQTLSNGSPQTAASANAYAKFLFVEEFGTGTSTTTWGSFQSPSFRSTLICIG